MTKKAHLTLAELRSKAHADLSAWFRRRFEKDPTDLAWLDAEGARESRVKAAPRWQPRSSAAIAIRSNEEEWRKQWLGGARPCDRLRGTRAERTPVASVPRPRQESRAERFAVAHAAVLEEHSETFAKLAE